MNTAYVRCCALTGILWAATWTAHAATFEVTNTMDSGPGSLREALTNAFEGTSGIDVVDVQLPPGTLIEPDSELPPLQGALDGDITVLQGNGVVLSGENLSGSEVGLRINSNGHTVRDVTIVNFPSHGISISGNENFISGCQIGTNGATAEANGGDGINIVVGSDNVIGWTAAGNTGNVISGNTGMGIRMSLAAEDTVIAGNLIGTNAAGTAAIPNGESGIDAQTIGMILGGPAPGQRNVISGNTEQGIQVRGNGQGGIIQGNYIGTNAAGTAAIPNGMNGIDANGNNESLKIGGTEAGEGNVISGNANAGMTIQTDNTVIQGNRIGVAAETESGIPNTGGGLAVVNAQDVLIGGTASGAGNKIAFNNGFAIALFFGSAGVTISRNSIHDTNGDPMQFSFGTNGDISPPTITGVLPVTGSAVANSTVEFFVDDADEGKTFVGSTTANGSGAFSSAEDLNAFIGMNLTATATDGDGSTSPFSTPFLIPDVTFEGEEGEGEGEGGPVDCDPEVHSADTNQDNSIGFSELLRVIQIFNLDTYTYCPESDTEDGFCPGVAP